MLKRIAALLLSVVFVVAAVPSVQAVTYPEIEQKEASTAQHLLTCPVPKVSSIGGEWLVIGLARSGKLTQQTSDGYYANVQSYIKSVGGAKLHRSKSTENARVILALTAIGKDPQNVDGVNLLQPLADFDFVKKQGVNGPIWTLLALDSFQYEIPVDSNVKRQTTRVGLIEYILDNQCTGGGWDLDGESADTDITGMAIQALAPYTKQNPNVKNAVDKALTLMSSVQSNNGDFSTKGEVTPESDAQMICALSAMQIDCNDDERFIKNHNSVLDSLVRFSVTDGFAHVQGMDYNQMSTEQGYYALTAYIRMKNGQTPLFDMTDHVPLGDVNQSGTATIGDATLIQKYIAKALSFSLLQQKISDINNDGKVDINDVTALQKRLAA